MLTPISASLYAFVIRAFFYATLCIDVLVLTANRILNPRYRSTSAAYLLSAGSPASPWALLHSAASAT